MIIRLQFFFFKRFVLKSPKNNIFKHLSLPITFFYYSVTKVSLYVDFCIQFSVFYVQHVHPVLIFFISTVCVRPERSPCLYVSISPFLHVSMSPYLNVSGILQKGNQTTENGNFRLVSSIRKWKWQTSILLLQTQTAKNGKRRLLFQQTSPTGGLQHFTLK
jgi:hypothetical protein